MDKQQKRLAKLLAVHPLPWHIGEEHESKAVIEDANNKQVAILNAYPLLGQNVNTVARLLVGALNKERARVVTEEMEKQNGL